MGSRQDRYLHRPRLSARRPELLPPPHVRATRSAYTYFERLVGKVRNAYIRNFAQREPFGGMVDILRASTFPLRESCTIAWIAAEIIYIQTADTVTIREGVLPVLRFPGFQHWALQLDPFCASRRFLWNSSFVSPDPYPFLRGLGLDRYTYNYARRSCRRLISFQRFFLLRF